MDEGVHFIHSVLTVYISLHDPIHSCYVLAWAQPNAPSTYLSRRAFQQKLAFLQI